MKSRTKVIIALVAMVSVAVAQYVYGEKMNKSAQPVAPKEYQMQATDVEIKYDFDSHADFYCDDAKGFFYCTKDGMKYYSSNGEMKWDNIFNMVTPIMIGECGIVAVSEPKGRNVYVYDQDGLLYDIHLDNPILSFSVSKLGQLSVIIEKDADYEVLLYGKTGGDPLWRYRLADSNIMPVSADVSNDGRVLVLSSMDTNGVYIKSNLTFFYINDSEARNYEDGIFGGKTKEEQIIAQVRFMEGNRLVTVSDQEVRCYGIEENSVITDQWSLPLENRIDYVEFYSDKSFVLTLGEPLINQEGKPAGTVLFYNVRGAETGRFQAGRRVSHVSVGHDAAIIGENRTFTAVTSNGDVLWRYTALQDVRQLIFLDNRNMVLMTTATSGNIMKRMKSN